MFTTSIQTASCLNSPTATDFSRDYGTQLKFSQITKDKT
jgi:hypothetical protein